MQLTVTTLSDEIFSLEVGEDLDLASFKALCEQEISVPAHQIAILWKGQPLYDDRLTLRQYGICDGDMLLLQQITGQVGQRHDGAGQRLSASGLPQIDFGSIQLPGVSGRGASQPQSGDPNPETIRSMFLADPHQLALLKERNPPLAEALNDPEKFTRVFTEQQEERRRIERERQALFTADPFDPEVQKRIAEEIRNLNPNLYVLPTAISYEVLSEELVPSELFIAYHQGMKNVETNMETAIEFAPESFGQVVMLYIDCMVNGHPVKAFVDSGAQMTIMSQACAERCHIMRLVDHRWAGVAKGVGTQEIIGRVHLCQIQIGPVFFQSSFSILKDQPMDMLLGLDMLKRHQCIIDLRRNVLIFGTTGTETPFLSESELPAHARLNMNHNATDEDQDLARALAQSEQTASLRPQSSASSAASSRVSVPQQQQPVAGPSHSASTTSNLTFSESSIVKLMNYGFSRAAVMEELRRARGDADQALAALLAKSLNWQ